MYEKISLVISVHRVLTRYLLNCSWMSLSLNCLIPFSNSLTFINIAFNLSWSSLWVLRLFWAVEAIMLSNSTLAAARPDLFSKLPIKICETWDLHSEVYGNPSLLGCYAMLTVTHHWRLDSSNPLNIQSIQLTSDQAAMLQTCIWCYIQILAKITVIPTRGFAVFFPVLPCHNSTLTRPWLLTSKSLPIHVILLQGPAEIPDDLATQLWVELLVWGICLWAPFWRDSKHFSCHGALVCRSSGFRCGDVFKKQRFCRSDSADMSSALQYSSERQCP